MYSLLLYFFSSNRTCHLILFWKMPPSQSPVSPLSIVRTIKGLCASRNECLYETEWNITFGEKRDPTSGERGGRRAPTLKPHHHPSPALTNNRHNWLCLFIVYNCNIISSAMKTKGFNTHAVTHTPLIKACLTAPSQSTMELCWHGTAWGMGRSKVYDCADVNDIIQILNQAACFQPSGSSPLAVGLENLAWIAAAEQSDSRAPERSRAARVNVTSQMCSGCHVRGQQSVRPCVCASIHSYVYS